MEFLLLQRIEKLESATYFLFAIAGFFGYLMWQIALKYLRDIHGKVVVLPVNSPKP